MNESGSLLSKKGSTHPVVSTVRTFIGCGHSLEPVGAQGFPSLDGTLV